MEPKKTKLLICLLYWHGDLKEVERLVRLGCDLRKEITEDAELMFVQRYDSPAPSAAIQLLAQSKFIKVHVWKCNRKALGFPAGCNELAYGILNHICIQRHMNGAFKDIDAIMILEGDCIITRPTWIEELIQEWEKGKREGKSIVGTIQEPTPEYQIKRHVNAVAMWDADIVRILPCLIGGPNQTGWDHYHGDSTVPVAMNSPLFWLDYRKPTVTPKEIFEDHPDVLIYHGVKDDSGIRAVREKFNLDPK